MEGPQRLTVRGCGAADPLMRLRVAFCTECNLEADSSFLSESSLVFFLLLLTNTSVYSYQRISTLYFHIQEYLHTTDENLLY